MLEVPCFRDTGFDIRFSHLERFWEKFTTTNLYVLTHKRISRGNFSRLQLKNATANFDLLASLLRHYDEKIKFSNN